MRHRVLVCGGRDWADVAPLREALGQVPRNSVVIEGDALGADRCAQSAVDDLNSRGHNLWLCRCPADWEVLDKAAGPVRNQEMLDEFVPHAVIALPGGRGTDDMKSRARLMGIPVVEIGKHS